MQKPTKIAIADVLKMREAAEQRPAPECAEVSRQRAITMMAPSLVAMHERGHTWPAIVQWLAEQGLHITSTTLHKVLRQAALKRDEAPETPQERAPRRPPAAAEAKPTRKGARAALPVDGPAPAAATRAHAPRSVGPAAPAAATATSRDPSSDAPSQTPTVPKGTFVMRPDTPNL